MQVMRKMITPVLNSNETQNTPNILIPVNPKDFSPDFNKNISVNVAVNVMEAFQPMINQVEKFALNKYFWFIANPVKGVVEYAGGMVEEMIGVSIADFEQKMPEKLFTQTHPDDLPQMFAFTNYWINLFNNLPYETKIHIHPTIYLRLQNKHGIYNWVMVQFADQLLDTNGNIIYGLTLITDISHIKKEGPVMMSILNTIDETCQHFYCTDGNGIEKSSIELPKFTQRELEILTHLAAGRSSKQIASELDIAIKTVDNHRQRMLEKVSAKSSAELVSFGIKSGYI